MPYFKDLFQETSGYTYSKSDWKEVIENAQPGGGDTFSLQASSGNLVIKVPWLKARSFIQFVLGFSYADEGSPYRLRRKLPVQHPRFPWMTATNVSFSGQVPVGVNDVGTKVAGIFSSSLPVAKYDHLIATVSFADQPWDFLPDSDASTPAAETRRYTYFDPVPSIEIISAEGLNNIKFAYSPGVPDGPPNEPIPAPFGTLMAKVTYTLNWMQVAQEYISSAASQVFFPSKILGCVGRVNTTTFMGFGPGTLLLQPPVFQRFRFPLTTATGVYGYFGWNIRFPMQYFNPTAGPQAGVPPGIIYAGHQLIPWRSNLSWYPCQREDGSSKLYPEADFNNIFTHVLAP